MTRRHPDRRCHVFAAKDFKGRPKLHFLLGRRQACKFTTFMQTDDAGISRHVAMLKSMQTDRRSCALPLPNVLPKAGVWCAVPERFVPIVRNDGQDRLDVYIA